jgi:hypothetical protein
MHAIFREVLHHRNNAYIANKIVRCTIPHIPLDFMKRFMAKVAWKGRLESAKTWDKEGPRVLAKTFKDNKTLFFTALGVVARLASFEELDAVIREEEVAFGPLRQPAKRWLFSPSAASRSFLGVERGLRRRRAIHNDRYCMHGNYLVQPKCNDVSLTIASSRLHQFQALAAFAIVQGLASLYPLEGEVLLKEE